MEISFEVPGYLDTCICGVFILEGAVGVSVDATYEQTLSKAHELPTHLPFRVYVNFFYFGKSKIEIKEEWASLLQRRF